MSLIVRFNRSNRTCILEDELPRRFSDSELWRIATCLRHIPEIRHVVSVADRAAYALWFVNSFEECQELVKRCVFLMRAMR